jgi:hypothetical protein
MKKFFNDTVFPLLAVAAVYLGIIAVVLIGATIVYAFGRVIFG